MKIPSALVLVLVMASAASSFTVTPSARCHRSLTTTTKLQGGKMFDSVEEAIAEAQRICAEDPTSPDCKVMWDIVEELEAADSHASGIAPPKELSRQKKYASVLSSFDMLEQAAERQMEQLKALTDTLADLEVSDPSVTKLGELAVEMKQALEEAKASLPKSI